MPGNFSLEKRTIKVQNVAKRERRNPLKFEFVKMQLLSHVSYGDRKGISFQTKLVRFVNLIETVQEKKKKKKTQSKPFSEKVHC